MNKPDDIPDDVWEMAQELLGEPDTRKRPKNIERAARALLGYGQCRADEATEKAGMASFDLESHLWRQREWSANTFGPGKRTHGVIAHIRKELSEIEANPNDITEWIDVVILALDGAWRHGFLPDEIIGALVAKQTKNEARMWPDWTKMSENDAIEHDRSLDDTSIGSAK